MPGPTTYAALQHAGLTPGQPVLVHVDPAGGPSSILTDQATYDVLDDASGAILATLALNLRSGSPGVTDFGTTDFASGNEDGTSTSILGAIYAFFRIGSGPVTPTGTSVTVRLSAPVPAGSLGFTVMPRPRHTRVSPHPTSAMTLVNATQYQDPHDHATYYKSASDATLVGSSWAGFTNDFAVPDGTGDRTVSPGTTGIAATAIVCPPRSAGAGKDMILLRFTSGGVPTNLTALTTAPTATANGTTLSLGTPIWQASPAAPALFLPVNSVIPTGATVLVSAPSGFATTAAGSAPALVNLAAANRGRILSTIPARAGTLRAGYNLNGQYYGGTTFLYSNMAKAGTWGLGSGALTLDANGYPLTSTGSNYLFTCSDPGTDYGGAGKGTDAAPQGKYTVIWDRTDVTGAIPGGATVETSLVSTDAGHATGNRAIVDFRDNARFGPNIQLYLQGSAAGGGNYRFDVGGRLEVYPPDPADPSGNTPWASPPKYNPSFKAQFGAAKGWRWMDGCPVNLSNIRTIADMIDSNCAGYAMYRRLDRVAVTRVEAYTGTDTYVWPHGVTVALVTTGSAHGFQTGDAIGFGSTVGSYQAPGSGGSTTSNPMYTQGGRIKVLSSTTFTVGLAANIESAPMSNVLTPTPGPESVATRDYIGGGIPWDDCGNITTWLQAEYMWRNLPHLIEDAAIATIAARDAATMPAGSKVIVEWSNECWNYYFDQNPHICAMTREFLGGGDAAGRYDYGPWQVYRGVQAFRVYKAAWVAAGRSAADVEHFLGVSPGSPDVTNLLTLAAGPAVRDLGGGNSITFNLVAGTTTRVLSGVPTTVTYPGLGTIDGDIHHIGPAPYVDNEGYSDSSLSSTMLALDKDQHCDLLEWKIESGYFFSWVDGHRAAIAASTLTHKPTLALYEWNFAGVVPAASKASQSDAWVKELAVYRHPRIYDMVRANLAQMESAGATHLNAFVLNGGNRVGHYDTYVGWRMAAGTGSPSENPDYADLPNVKSEVGGGINTFMGAGTDPAPPDEPTPTPGSARRRGRRRLVLACS